MRRQLLLEQVFALEPGPGPLSPDVAAPAPASQAHGLSGTFLGGSR